MGALASALAASFLARSTRRVPLVLARLAWDISTAEAQGALRAIVFVRDDGTRIELPATARSACITDLVTHSGTYARCTLVTCNSFGEVTTHERFPRFHVDRKRGWVTVL